MNDIELAKWLRDLAACYDCFPQKAAIERYLRILPRWKLSPSQAETLGDEAVLRFTRKFPMRGDLQEIYIELKKQEQIQADTEFIARLVEAWESRTKGGADENRLLLGGGK